MSEYAVASAVESDRGVLWTTDISVHTLTNESMTNGLKALHIDGWNLLTATAAAGPGGIMHTLYLERT